MRTAVVSPGVNAVPCDCGDGTVFVSVTMRTMAALRHDSLIEYKGECHIGHKQTIMLTANAPKMQ